jgi:hypothetical protein
MCAPFAIWEGFKTSCEPEKVEQKQLRILQRALATAAVQARNVARANQHNGRRRWHWCNLAFSDNTLEEAFRMYYSDLRSSRMRTGMLTFCSLYITYALIVWSKESLKYELYLRTGYLCFLLLAFLISFSKTWENWSQVGSFVVATVTLIEVVGEAIITDHLLGPFTLILLILFMLAWNVFVRFRFMYTVLLCMVTGFFYFGIVVVFFQNGDRSVPANQVPGNLAWNTIVLLLTSVFIGKMSHRQEVSSRYNFLSNMHRAAMSAAAAGNGTSSFSSSEDAAFHNMVLSYSNSPLASSNLSGGSGINVNSNAGGSSSDGGNTSGGRKNSSSYDRESGSIGSSGEIVLDHQHHGKERRQNMSSSDSPSNVARSVRKHLAGSPLDRPSDVTSDLLDHLPTLESMEKEGEQKQLDSVVDIRIQQTKNATRGNNNTPTLAEMAMRAKTNASEVFQRMTTEAGKSMVRIGHFNDTALSGTNNDSVASYFFTGDDDLSLRRSKSCGNIGNRQGTIRKRKEDSGSGEMHASLLSNTMLPSSNLEGDSEDRRRRIDSLLGDDGTIDEPVKLLKEPMLVNHDQLPSWFEPYSYTYTGYRLHYNDRLSWNSIWQCHNETQNM